MSAQSHSALFDAVSAVFAEEASEIVRRLEQILNELPAAAPEGKGALALELRRVLHTLKGSAAAAGADEIKAQAHQLEDGVQRLGPADFDAARCEELMLALDRVRQGLSPPPPPPSSDAAPSSQKAAEAPLAASFSADADMLRVRPQRADALHALVGELVITRIQYEALSRRLTEMRDRASETSNAWRQVNAQLSLLRVHMPELQWRQLQSMAQAFSMLIAGDAQALQVVAREVPLLQSQAAALSASLEDGIRDLRLMPLSPFLQEYVKLVREAAREAGKQARLSIRADGAEIDRAVLMRLRDSLLHLLRNAVVHGIEAPAQRRIAGKPEVGSIVLEAFSEGARVIIRITDDGGGIDVARVHRQAVRMKLIKESQRIEPRELLELLTHPGLSTREHTDGLAGRGIGLNVVESSIRDLDGRLQLDNLPGAGCIFSISVPIRAATSTGLTLRVGEQTFCILLSQIERAVRLEEKNILLLEGRPTTLIGGDPVAVVSLGSLLGIHSDAASAGKKPAVVLRQGRLRMAMLVDDIPGEQALVIKALPRSFAGCTAYSGGAIQADGSVLPVLQSSALFERAISLKQSAGLEEIGVRTARPREATILVVDDSITIRTLLHNILLAAHYQVVTAADGRAALHELSRLSRCDLIISDLQMPGMDGVELCRAVRRGERANLPVLIVTSVGDSDEKRRALEAGADGYVIKAEFEQGHFLELVARLTDPWKATA